MINMLGRQVDIMGFRLCLPVLLLTVLVCASTASARPEPDERAADTLLAITGDGFRIRHTNHFTIAFDTDPVVLSRLEARLEGSHRAIRMFCKRLNLPMRESKGNLMVILYGNRHAFDEHARRLGVLSKEAVGFYHTEENVALFAEASTHEDIMMIDTLVGDLSEQIKALGTGKANRERRDLLLERRAATLRHRHAIVDRFNRLVIQHETAHQTLYNFGVHVRGADNPTWVTEGLACQFEVPQTAPDGHLDGINHMRLADLKEGLGLPLDAGTISDEQIVRAIARGEVLPIRSMIEHPHRLHESARVAPTRYAEAWGLVYYLANRHKEAFGEYLRRLSSRKPGERRGPEGEWADFTASFSVENEEFQREWLAFIVKLPLDRYKAGR